MMLAARSTALSVAAHAIDEPIGGSGMHPSPTVRDTMLDFYARISANDVDSFDRLVSTDPATLVIGTSPGEWVTERERLRFGFEAEGLAIVPGSTPAGYEHGQVGWFADEPTYTFPGGSTMRTRLTSVLQLEDGNWRIVHMHVSVGVPDEDVVELQARWGSA
jgi:ketosteroid isomerase-like protein